MVMHRLMFDWTFGSLFQGVITQGVSACAGKLVHEKKQKRDEDQVGFYCNYCKPHEDLCACAPHSSIWVCL